MSTKIEWTEETWNPVTGCTRVSSGCDHCYAATMTRRLEVMGVEKYMGLVHNGHFNGKVRCHEDLLEIPLRRKKPTTYFVNSMSDMFHPGVSLEFVDKVFAVMAWCRQHTFQILTKRPERMAEYSTDLIARGYQIGKAMDAFDPPRAPSAYWSAATGKKCEEFCYSFPLPNVWLGTSCEDQATADERIPHLLRCPAAVRFLSLEPLLGAIDITVSTRPSVSSIDYAQRVGYDRIGAKETIDWVIVGGESGPGARPMELDWVRSIRDQCQAAGVAFFFKQIGGVNKKRAGRLLDGREWNERPKIEGPRQCVTPNPV